MMNKKMLDLLKELTANCRQSDRDLSKKINLTQPTVSRLRKKLENENHIESYTIIPNLSKLDIELVVITTLKWNDYNKTEELDGFKKFLKYDKRVLFAAPGEGFSDKTKIIMTFHRNYKSFELFLREMRAKWKNQISGMESFIVSSENIITNFDFNIINRLDE